MNLHDYQSLQPRDIPDEDVFVCTSFYMPESKSIAQRKAETTTVTSSPMEPLTRKRSFVKAHCTGEPVLPEIAATLPSTVQFGKGACVLNSIGYGLKCVFFFRLQKQCRWCLCVTATYRCTSRTLMLCQACLSSFMREYAGRLQQPKQARQRQSPHPPQHHQPEI